MRRPDFRTTTSRRDSLTTRRLMAGATTLHHFSRITCHLAGATTRHLGSRTTKRIWYGACKLTNRLVVLLLLRMPNLSLGKM